MYAVQWPEPTLKKSLSLGKRTVGVDHIIRYHWMLADKTWPTLFSFDHFKVKIILLIHFIDLKQHN